ncbi:hypothetical protein THRCLA_20283 [Thraustotheca clavata]|uniref:Uncharacterized protein n=1 Tax=Thraustotheca clavata TaxID=74557 RepID=A0A1W0A992_9STRA|nr:hypothetical protein THRCLA_20283 [Thraustotheca clavata]
MSKRCPLIAAQCKQMTKELLYEIGGEGRILEFCIAFYQLASADPTLQTFLFDHDNVVSHGQRLAKWIVNYMEGNEDLCEPGWEFAHYHTRCQSEKKPLRAVCFSVRDCRTWMRLHFWAMRQCGLDRNGRFWAWYVQLIHQHIALHNSYAPGYTIVDSVWSTIPGNLQMYKENGQDMVDLCPSYYC